MAVFPVVLEELLVGHFLEKFRDWGRKDFFNDKICFRLGLGVPCLFGLLVVLHGVSPYWLAWPGSFGIGGAVNLGWIGKALLVADWRTFRLQACCVPEKT